jgi:SpoVK/Ycf46/Vps4 family AAA+-type ATPase
LRHVLKENRLDGLLSEDEIERISAKYRVNAGGIVDAIKNLNAAANNGHRSEFVRKLETVLKHHEVAITGDEQAKNDYPESGAYNLGALNASQNLEKLITALKKNPLPGKNVTLLFYGMPGTGKTQFAIHLAKELGKEMKFKRASDLLSMFVGGTEKAMAEAFKEASADDAILFLDEADSFFYPRESAVRSWEKTQVNELLMQMERHKGVFICATNIINGLDEAAIRRFNFKIEFRPLTPEGVLAMYNLRLSGLADSALTDVEREELKNVEFLTTGDFNAVAKRYELLGEKAANKELIGALLDEVRHKSNKSKVGF